MAAWGQPAPALSPQNPNGDHVVQSPPSDGVSSLSFSPGSNMLAAGSWDNKVSVYELSNSPMMDAPTAMPRAQTALDGPVMCTSFSADGQYVFAGGCDKTVRMWQLANAGAPAATIGQHDAPVKHVFAVSEMSLVASGGWDRTVRFWDSRQPTPAAVDALTLVLADAQDAGEIEDAVVAGTDRQAQALWAWREDISESLHPHTLYCVGRQIQVHQMAQHILSLRYFLAPALTNHILCEVEA